MVLISKAYVLDISFSFLSNLKEFNFVWNCINQQFMVLCWMLYIHGWKWLHDYHCLYAPLSGTYKQYPYALFVYYLQDNSYLMWIVLFNPLINKKGKRKLQPCLDNGIFTASCIVGTTWINNDKETDIVWT